MSEEQSCAGHTHTRPVLQAHQENVPEKDVSFSKNRGCGNLRGVLLSSFTPVISYLQETRFDLGSFSTGDKYRLEQY